MMASMRVPAMAALLILAVVGCAARLPPAEAPAPVPAPAPQAAHDSQDPHFDYFVLGDPSAPRAAATRFGLALMGGGGTVDAAYRFIVERAGGGHLVILGAQEDAILDPSMKKYSEMFASRWGRTVSAETIMFHDREAAADPRVLKAIEGADGIFLMGGDQSLYIRYWKGTPVQALLDAHVRANRPIGGSSAGLAVLGHYVYGALDGGSLESKVALADPFGGGVTIERDFLHFRMLEEVMTDTHFSARHRLGRLVTCLARLRADDPDVFGIGVDEKTALLVGEDGIGRLAEGSAGSAWIVMPEKPAAVLEAGQPLAMAGIRLTRLDTRGSIDLASRKIDHPAAAAVIAVAKGRLTAPSIASPLFARDKVPPGED